MSPFVLFFPIQVILEESLETSLRTGAGSTDLAKNRKGSDRSPTDMQSASFTRRLKRDFQDMTNKCIELQIRLNEERELMNMLLGKTKSLNTKNLAQEVVSLREQLNIMKHYCKAAVWKLQEVRQTNEIALLKRKLAS